MVYLSRPLEFGLKFKYSQSLFNTINFMKTVPSGSRAARVLVSLLLLSLDIKVVKGVLPEQIIILDEEISHCQLQVFPIVRLFSKQMNGNIYKNLQRTKIEK